MAVVKTALLKKGMPASALQVERFTAEEVLMDIDPDAKARPIRILLHEEELSFTVPPNTHILKSALQQGYDLPYSCQRGICSTCVGKLTQGKVKMDKNEGLTEDEVAKGYVLLCQSHPLTDDVVVEIGR